MRVSIILSTYNHPDWLEKVLWGYELQTHKDFEIVIADDGSGEPTKKLIERFREQSSLKILHAWHEDRGFQKSAILNKATCMATTEYLIYSDGDCIPRKDFVEVHVRKATKGRFLSGGYFMLTMEISNLISKEDIESQRVFDKEWLYKHGLPHTYKTLKLTSKGNLERFLNWVAPNPTWNGHSSSGWKEDILAVNGYNEEMQYGGQDRELGERLINNGVKPIQIRYSAVCVHLDHKRGYKTPESINKNLGIREETKRRKKTWTDRGIIKGDKPTLN